MVIKTFKFPSFEEWNKTRRYKQKIGDYTCAIKIVAWGCGENTENDYEAVIANSDNPTNIYVGKIFDECTSCDVSDKNTLKEWYEAVIEKINDMWKKFILDTYFCVEETSHTTTYDAVKIDEDTQWHCPICNAYVYENEHRCPECNSEIRIPHE